MNTTDIPFIAPRPGIPRRVFIGAFLAAMGAASLVGPGFVNSHDTQTSTFNFTRGTSLESGAEDAMRAWFVANGNTPRSQIQIIGHSGTQGNEDANRALSEQRAQMARSIAAEVGLTDMNFDFVGGVGGGDPLTKRDDESDREFQRRLARVTLTTVYE